MSLDFWEALDLEAWLADMLRELHGQPPVTDTRRNELVSHIKQAKRRLDALRKSI